MTENHSVHRIAPRRWILWKGILVLVVSILGIAFFDADIYAQQDTIPKGVSIEHIDISGKTPEKAIEAVNDYVSGFTSKNITLSVDGNQVNVTAGELGYYWKNTDVIEKAAAFCTEGNVIQRYKERKKIEKEGVIYPLNMDINDEIMRNTINERCGVYNIPHVNASLKRTGSGFEISEESGGRMIDMETSVSELHHYLAEEWTGEEASFTLKVVDDEPVATVEDCERVKDLLGTYSTKFSTSGSNYSRNKNMENGMRLLDGITLCQGETMSVNAYLEPWTEDNGWYPGGTYVNGKVEDSLGGGICQVSSTLYNAALNSELEIVQRSNHSMNVGYVPLAMDAALAGTWKDLKIRNNTNTPVYIEAIYSTGRLTFNIYGEETRPSNRRVEYVSETISTIPSSEVVTQDPNQPEGYRAVTETGHTGYKAKLWKRVYVDGVLTSEEVVNTSTYASSPTYVIEGTGAAVPPEESSEPSSDVPAVAEPQTTKPADEPRERSQEPQTTQAVQTEPATQPQTEPATEPQTEPVTEPQTQPAEISQESDA